MELELRDDQELLRDTAARFIGDTCPLPVVRRLAESETGLDPGYLARAAELGWFAMLVPEEHGGGSISGDGLRDLAIVAEERGRGLQPGPFVPMNVVLAAVARSGTSEQRTALLPSLVAGEAIATWVVADCTGGFDPGAAVRAVVDGNGFVLEGEAGLVQDGGIADWFLVTAEMPTGLTQFVLPAATVGISVKPLVSHDITQRFAEVRFDSVWADASSVLGEAGAAASDVERQLQLALVLAIAESVGAADTLFEMARQYAVDRVAFGRPIGSFQAVKHQLADLSLSLEAAKAVAVAATRAVQAGDDDAGEIASIAKAWMGEVAIDIAQGCFQVFAGIGYTWEHDSHLFLRRLTMSSLLFGQPDWHRERICSLHGL